MTTFEPGASDVFTHGLTSSPRSTAFLASRPAPSITDGLDVFVHDVIAAITTWPWSSVVSGPSASVTGTPWDSRSATCRPPVPLALGARRAAGARARLLAVLVARAVAVVARRVGGGEGLLDLLVHVRA